MQTIHRNSGREGVIEHWDAKQNSIGAFTVISTRLNSDLNSLSQLGLRDARVEELVSTHQLRVAPLEAQQVLNSFLNSFSTLPSPVTSMALMYPASLCNGNILLHLNIIHIMPTNRKNEHSWQTG